MMMMESRVWSTVKNCLKRRHWAGFGEIEFFWEHGLNDAAENKKKKKKKNNQQEPLKEALEIGTDCTGTVLENKTIDFFSRGKRGEKIPGGHWHSLAYLVAVLVMMTLFWKKKS